MDYCPNCNHNLRPYKEKSTNGTSEDAIYSEVKNLTLDKGEISAAMLQKEFDVGFARASRLIDALEDNGVIEYSDKDTIRIIK